MKGPRICAECSLWEPINRVRAETWGLCMWMPGPMPWWAKAPGFVAISPGDDRADKCQCFQERTTT